MESSSSIIPNAALLPLVTILLLIAFRFYRAKHVYLIDFLCYRAPDHFRVPRASFVEHVKIHENFQGEAGDFQDRVLTKSGLGDETYLPSGLHVIPPDTSLPNTIAEIENILFSISEDLFSKHAVKPENIDILICNCSLAVPIPSITSMVVNRFGLRDDIKSFNISGMGCSSGLLAINMAWNLLKVHPNTTALILSMESVSSNSYMGKVKSMLLPNCLFRMGGAVALLSNKKQDRAKAKYELLHVITTHLACKDTASYTCVMQVQDDEGLVGVSLSRAVPQVASEALKTNISMLAPLVLPYSELMLFGLSVLRRKIWPASSAKGGAVIPNFRKAFDHYCIHAGGKGVIEKVKVSLKLEEKDIEASKMTLHRFGNTSSSSTWYAFSYLEAKGVVRNGDRLWQVSPGSGFKCNSAVWRCIARTKIDTSKNVWNGIIHSYPVDDV